MTQPMLRSRAPANQERGKSLGCWNRDDHIRHRDYSPTLGRFIERDPIGFEAGDNNWYRFAANGPTGKTDPNGLQLGTGSSGGNSSGNPSGGGGACYAWWHGAGMNAMWDAGFGETYREAMAFGDEWQKRRGGGWGNAARHAYWQAMLACKYGSNRARLIGDAHECSSNDSTDSRIDQFNNGFARAIGIGGSRPCNKEEIRARITKALNEGLFITDESDPRVPRAPAN